jgi:predicted TIM-barrel fold metal-dependent hydrolase
MVVIPFWNPSLAVDEVLRCAGRGAKAIAFSENLHSLGFSSIHSGAWDDLFAVLDETELPLCTHIGSSSTVPSTGPDAPYGITAVNINFNLALSTTDWLFSGKLQKFPNLKIVLAEGGIGWIPFLLERAEQVAFKYASSRGTNWVRDPETGLTNPVPVDPTLFPESPRQLFRDHMYGCFIQDEFGAANLDAIGVENVLIETDYPHTDTLWPHSMEMAQKMLGERSEADKQKVLRGNAMRIFHFEPASPASRR